MRPLLRMKKSDVLLTFESVVQWCDSKSEAISFNITGCILFLLFVQAGSAAYPEIDVPFLEKEVDHVSFKSGWNEHYGKLPVKYSTTLMQTKPRVAPDSRGKTVIGPKKSGISLTKDQVIENTRLRRKRCLPNEG